MATEQPTVTHDVHHDIHEEPEFDVEVSRRKVIATGVGILVLTALSMVGMWFLSEYFLHLARAEHLPLTPVQEERREALRETHAQRSAVEIPIFPQLSFPHDVESPPEPPVQVLPGLDMEALRSTQSEELTTLGWANRSTDKARVPVDQAMERLLREGLPRRSESPPAEAAYGADDVAPAVAEPAPIEAGGPGTDDDRQTDPESSENTDSSGDAGAGSEAP